MSQIVQRLGDRAQKSLAHLSANQIHQVIKNNHELVRQGLDTPLLLNDRTESLVTMPWINGIHRTALIRLIKRDLKSNSNHGEGISIIENITHLIVSLHACKSIDLNLRTFDCWRRIQPRLVVQSDEVDEDINNELAGIYALLKKIQKTEIQIQVNQHVIVHGDFHVGQLMYVKKSKKLWLLDLDDLAIGDRESDIANFAAHFATRTLTNPDQILDQYLELSWYFLDIYQIKFGNDLDKTKLDFYGACALLRRTMKLREQNITLLWSNSLQACKTLVRQLNST